MSTPGSMADTPPAALLARIAELEARLADREAELREQRRRLDILAASPVGVYVASIDRPSEVFVSSHIERIVGYTPAEWQADPTLWDRLLHPEDYPSAAEQLAQALATGERLCYEYRIRHRDGRWVWLHEEAEVVVDADGQRRYQAFFYDISAGKASELFARSQEARYQELVENLPDVIARLDRGLRLCYISPNFERYTGLPAGSFFTPDGPAPDSPFYPVFEGMRRTVLRVFARGEPEVFEFTWPLAGSAPRYEARVVPEAAPDGAITTVLLIARDVTEQRASEERLRTILSGMPVMLDAFDEHRRLTAWNAECERVTGYSAAEMIGRDDVVALLYPDEAYRAALIAEWRRRGSNFRNWELTLTRKDGDQRVVSWSNVSGGLPVPGWSFWAIGVDVTEQRRAEAALRAREEQLRQQWRLQESLAGSLRVLHGHGHDQAARRQILSEVARQLRHGLGAASVMVWELAGPDALALSAAATEGGVIAGGGRTASLAALPRAAREQICAGEPAPGPLAVPAFAALAEGAAEYVLLPIGWPDTTWGLMAIGAALGRPLGAEDLILATTIVDITRTTIRRWLAVDDLQASERRLRLALAEQREAEAAVRQLNADLERRVEARTTELAQINVALGQEIAERIRAEEAMRENQRFIERVLAASPARVSLFDFGLRRVVYSSAPLSTALGYTPEELEGLGGPYPIGALIHPDDMAQIPGQVRRQLAMADDEVLVREFRMRHADGSWRWFVTYDVVFSRDSDGRPAQLLGQVLDITARKEAETRLAEAFQRLEQLNADLRRSSDLIATVINSLEDGLALLDAEGRVLMANRAIMLLCRLDQAAIIGRPWAAICPLGHALLERARGEKLPVASRERIERDGLVRVFDLQISPLPQPNVEQQTVLYLADVTERLQLQELNLQNERLAAMGRLAAIVAHEVNSPLQALQNFLFLAASDDPAERDAYLRIIADEIDRIGGLIRRLLDLQRPGDDSLRRVDLNTLIERVLRLTSGMLSRHQVQVSRRLSAEPLLVTGRSGQLTQLLLNLILNAVEAMPQGGTLTVGAAHRGEGELAAPPAGVAAIEVADSGPGIPAETIARVFEAFYTTKPTGSGLGLAISAQIVEQHGGRISARNLSPHGAAFTILLPLAEPGGDETPLV